MISVLVTALLVAGSDRDGASVETPADAYFIEAPALPDGRKVAVGSGGGTSAGEPTGFVSARWAVTPRLSLTAGVAYLEAKASPSAGIRLKLVDGLAAALRVKSEGFEPEGAEVEAALVGGVRVGRLDFLASATVGYGEETVDLEGAAAARTQVGHFFDTGVEGRYRGTPDGARHDLVAGPELGVSFADGTVRLQALVGYSANEKDSGLGAFAGLSVTR